MSGSGCKKCGSSSCDNVRVIIGEQGPQGPTGPAPTIQDGTTTTLPPGEPASVELESVSSGVYKFNFSIPAGYPGSNGTNGTNGWSPVLAIITDGNRRVLQIVDWTGGSGSKPSTINQFIGATGIVGSAALAVDIRGASGAAATDTPVGVSVEWNGDSDPTGGLWLLEDGRAISRSTYSALFAIIGTKFGAGNGSTTFNIPNSKGKIAVMKDTSVAIFNTIGNAGGARSAVIAANQLPISPPWQIVQTPHSHGVKGNSNTSAGTNGIRLGDTPPPTLSPYGTELSNANVSMGNNVGGGQPLDIMNPYIVKNKIIKVL